MAVQGTAMLKKPLLICAEAKLENHAAAVEMKVELPV
jgi:hypothetical protein